MMDDTEARSQSATRSWMKAEARLGREAARPIVLLGLAGTLLAMGQALSAAIVLTAALAGVGQGVPTVVPTAALVGFGVMALLRAGLQLLAERAAFAAGATARRRLRSDILRRLL